MKTVVTYHRDGNVSISHGEVAKRRTRYFSTVSSLLHYMYSNDLTEDETVTEL